VCTQHGRIWLTCDADRVASIRCQCVQARAIAAIWRSPDTRTAAAGVTWTKGEEPIFGGAADFDLELIESRTLDGNIQELSYQPALHA
jgi:hypothetical protein